MKCPNCKTELKVVLTAYPNRVKTPWEVINDELTIKANALQAENKKLKIDEAIALVFRLDSEFAMRYCKTQQDD